MGKKIIGFVPGKASTTKVRTEQKVKDVASKAGAYEASQFDSFTVGTIFAVPPIDHDCFGYDPNATIVHRNRTYQDQQTLDVYRNDSLEAYEAHFRSCFRNAPVVSTNGDVDFRDQLLVDKKTFRKHGVKPDGSINYIENPEVCTDFDDHTDVNYLRMSKTANNWDVIKVLAGSKWKVSHTVIAESLRYRTGLPPVQHFIHIPIFTRIGEWDDDVK